MGRQVIGQNADYPRLRNLFVSVIGTGLVLASIRFVLLKNVGVQPSSEKRELLTSPPPPSRPKRTFRPGIEPKGTFVANLKRSEYNYLPLVDMNDRGDYIFLNSPANATFRQYLHVFNGKSVLSPKVPTQERWALTPNGAIIKRNDLIMPFPGGRMNNGLTSWSFNDLRFFRRYTDDGSMIFVNTFTRKKVLTSQLKQERAGGPSKTFYVSGRPLSILEIDDKMSIWVRENLDEKGASKDQLLKFTGDKHESILFPPNYHVVDRISSTGSTVAGTFGNSLSTEPLRAFIQIPGGWKELPVPKGVAFSFVQKVFANGLILGFVTDENRENLKQVIWKDDSICILNDLPAWPKRSQLSVVTRASRTGDLYVRSVLNTENGASENYLLNVAP